jgi:hypothetical protein
MLSGPLAILLITQELTSVQQGIYYTFISLSSIQWVFELGISTCIIQYLSASKANDIKKYISFISLFLFVSSVLLFFFLILFADFIFSDVSESEWHVTWILYSFSVCLNMFFNSLSIIEEGCGRVNSAYKVKFISSILYTLGLVVTLFFGAGLYSLFFAQLGMLLANVIFLNHNFRLILQSNSGMSFRSIKETFKEVLGFQSKLSLVWLVGYLYWNSFSIIFFKYVSPEYAGQFGATNGVFGAVAAIATALINTKRVEWGKCNDNSEVLKSFREFKSCSIQGSCIYIVFSLLIVLVFFFLYDYDFVERFLPFFELQAFIFMRIAILFQEYVLLYLRTFKDEPLYKITIINYLAMPLFIFLFVFNTPMYLLYLLIGLIQTLFLLYYIKFLIEYVKRKIVEDD